MDDFDRDNDDFEPDHQPDGDEDEEEPPVSEYNNGKGIEVSVTFTPLPPPPAAGQKRRKNARARSVNRVLYIHETATLQTLLDTTFDNLGLGNKLAYGIGNRSGALSPHNFSITYSIQRTNYKDVTIVGIQDFDKIKEVVVEHRAPAFKLTITEFKPEEDGEGAENDEEEADEEEPARKKAAGPNAEEMEQNEIIKKLTQQYTCEDRTCTFRICYTAPPDAQHIHLTPLHLNTWASAMVGPNKQPGVDLDNPPNTKIFDVTYTDPTDLAMLSRRRLNIQNPSTAPSIIINNDFKDLAGLLHGDRGNNPPPPDHHNDHHRLHANAPRQVAPRPLRSAHVPKMGLVAFCEHFALSAFVLEKLDVINVTGPHCLRFISDAQLTDAELSISELADLRDAQERWALGVGPDGIHAMA
ncbi:hypothetical protein BV22DRAFT_1199411 [Leucogyrophana mollusca]|uniref:Uncharacterized protein n=1 Tax=Leucogyrophana mollusca TaxID=85980 RepID=A0ACB8B364_9AGAM|nr:hypothetical protein BV22DRAFT_1199411 [Leucogyrophana mollusca]